MYKNPNIVQHTDVNLDGGKYLVSTAYTWDHGYETMVFRYTNPGEKYEGPGGGDINWTDLYVRHYSSEVEAEEGHAETVANLATLLVEEEEEALVD